MKKLDPVCLFHGKKASEHHCLVCCLCFQDLTVEGCALNENGEKEDVCRACAEQEKSARAEAAEAAEQKRVRDAIDEAYATERASCDFLPDEESRKGSV